MGKKELTVFDPSDPSGIQMRSLQEYDLGTMSMEELATPQSVQLLGFMLRLSVARESRTREEVAALKKDLSRAEREREKFRVELASLERSTKLDWLKVPVSLLGGAGVTLVASDPLNLAGWLCAIAATTLLVMFYRFNAGGE